MEPTLKSGDQSKVTRIIQSVVNQMPKEEERFLQAVDTYIKDMKGGSRNSPNFKRTASEILESGYWIDCNEAGVLRITLLRAGGIPATYIQTLNKEHLRNWDPNAERLKYSGHIFLKALLKEGIRFVNSTTGEVTGKIPPHLDKGYEGIDSWDIGLKRGRQDMVNLFSKRSAEITDI